MSLFNLIQVDDMAYRAFIAKPWMRQGDYQTSDSIIRHLSGVKVVNQETGCTGMITEVLLSSRGNVKSDTVVIEWDNGEKTKRWLSGCTDIIGISAKDIFKKCAFTDTGVHHP